MNLLRYSCILVIAWLCIATRGLAQGYADSIHTIHTAVISANNQTRLAHSSVPLQMINAQALATLNVLQLSDAVKYFSGVSVKDYGGLGGMKTISIRSLGGYHTAINYDGITINDAQTGQIDLGRFSLDNVEAISVSTGQGNDIFQTARVAASAGVLNIQTQAPLLTGTPFAIRSTLTTGSFGLVNSRLLADFRINKKLSNSVNVEYMGSNGRYPFTQYYGGANDSTSREIRENSDVQSFRTELSSFYTFNQQSKFKSKIFYYQSERGLPGAVAFYNDARSGQRLWDKNFFAQGNYINYINSRWAFQSNGKFSWTYQRYLDPDQMSSYGSKENNYYQWEYYLSGSLLFKLSPTLSLSWASDATLNHMSADLLNFAYPTRFTALNVLTAKFTYNRLLIVGNTLSTGMMEDVDYCTSASSDQNDEQDRRNLHRITPSISCSYKLLEPEDLYLRLFYKEIFRVPSFNDLYYSDIGNPNLHPEYATQYNAGLSWTRTNLGALSSISMSIDAYHNRINDKIVARPTANLFKWSIQNIGKVAIYGLDLAFETQLVPQNQYKLIVSGAYTFQKAWDVTSSTDEVQRLTYKNQIPYTPEHSGSGRFVAEMPWITLSYGVVYSGGRYTLGQNLPRNFLKGYVDQNVSATKKIKIRNKPASIGVEVLNLANIQYQVVNSFPMPGRYFRFTASIKI